MNSEKMIELGGQRIFYAVVIGLALATGLGPFVKDHSHQSPWFLVLVIGMGLTYAGLARFIVTGARMIAAGTLGYVVGADARQERAKGVAR